MREWTEIQSTTTQSEVTLPIVGRFTAIKLQIQGREIARPPWMGKIPRVWALGDPGRNTIVVRDAVLMEFSRLGGASETYVHKHSKAHRNVRKKQPTNLSPSGLHTVIGRQKVSKPRVYLHFLT